LQLQLQQEWGIVETASPGRAAFGYRFYPDKVKGEGFFIAAFKKRGHFAGEAQNRKPKHKAEKLSAAEQDVVRPFLKNADQFSFIKQQDAVLALPHCLQEELQVLQSAVYIKKAGVSLGTIIRNELIPDHELAVSTIINNTVPVLEVDEATALQYLRRQDIKIDTSLKGWALIIYCNLPLGWVKILPNRINNYYPAAWRIVNK